MGRVRCCSLGIMFVCVCLCRPRPPPPFPSTLAYVLVPIQCLTSVLLSMRVCVFAFCVMTDACLLPCHDLWGFDPAFICRPGYGGPMPGGPGGYGGGPPPMYGAGFGRPPYVIPELVFFPPGLSSVWIGPVSCVPLVRCPFFCMERVCVCIVCSPGYGGPMPPGPGPMGFGRPPYVLGLRLFLLLFLLPLYGP